jgi:RecA-family ATPase
MNITSPVNPFEALWQMGYRRLCPITPPGCAVHPGAIADELAAGRDVRGKAPGLLRDGAWEGDSRFLTRIPTEDDLDQWKRWGAGVGIVASEGIVGLDADCLREADAAICREEIENRIGLLPTRVGRSPKALFVCRTDPEFRYDRLLFGEGERVEIIAPGKQFVAWGTHPGTLRPYSWTRKLVSIDELPYAPPETLRELMAALEQRLPNAVRGPRRGDGAAPNQDTLRGDPELVRAAVAATRNTSARFPGREDYLDYGYAIKAALPDHPDEAFEIFSEWCSRWDDGEGENEPEVVESDWRRMKPPFRRGASWLYELAEKSAPARFSRAMAWHEELPAPEPEPLFPEPPAAESDLPLVRASELLKTPPPPQRWLAHGLIPARQVTLLYGDGGTGKSLATLQLCVSVSSGRDWLGMTVEHGRSLFITAEDETAELHRRLESICKAEEIDPDSLADLLVLSLEGQDAVLAFPSPKTGLMAATALYTRIRRTIEQVRPTLLVLDTLADIFGGDEIKRIQARQFIQMMHAYTVGLDFDLSVVVPAHPSVAGMNSGKGTSGNTAWSNSVRSRLYLSRRFADDADLREPDPDVRMLAGKKANRARAGAEILLRWSAGRFIAEADDSSGEARTAANANDDAAFLEMLDEFNRVGRHAGENAAARNYGPRLFARMAQGTGIGEERLTSAMDRLFAAGAIVLRDHGVPSKGLRRIERQANNSSSSENDDPLFA